MGGVTYLLSRFSCCGNNQHIVSIYCLCELCYVIMYIIHKWVINKWKMETDRRDLGMWACTRCDIYIGLVLAALGWRKSTARSTTRKGSTLKS